MPVRPQNAAGWRMEPPVSVPVAAAREPRGHERGAAARRAARHPAGVPRVRDGPAHAVLVRRAHRELVHVRLAERHGAGRRQSLDHGRVERRDVALEHPRAAGRRHGRGDEDVLVGQRQAVEGPARLPRRAALVGRPRRRARAVGVDVHERVQRGAVRVDAFQERVGELDGGALAARERGGQPGHGPGVQRCTGAHSTTRGTR